MLEFSLPQLLMRLQAIGVWPSATGPSINQQQLHPLISADFVRRFAADESLICCYPPPFRTVAQERASYGDNNDFWERFGALDQIVPEKALIIGDFGIGSDSAIILDYARNANRPPVLRLQWEWEPKQRTNWVQGAQDFDEFARMLGLVPT